MNQAPWMSPNKVAAELSKRGLPVKGDTVRRWIPDLPSTYYMRTVKGRFFLAPEAIDYFLHYEDSAKSTNVDSSEIA